MKDGFSFNEQPQKHNNYDARQRRICAAFCMPKFKEGGAGMGPDELVELLKTALMWLAGIGIVIDMTPGIKFQPVRWLLGWVGKQMNKELQQDFEKLAKDFETHKVDSQRTEILDFANSAMNRRKHTKEEFDHIIKVHDDYLQYVRERNLENDLAEADVTAYVDHGIKLGIEDPKALVYFADLENQGGAGASKRVAAAAGTVTLSSIHAAALADRVMGRYSSRRNNVYNKANALNFTAGNGGNKMGVIDTAVQWMVGIANDNSHGYDQANRWGPNYDCSSLVITAYERAGVPVKSKGGATYTGNMKRAFLNNGFKDVTSSVNRATGAGMKKGDVLLNETHHTALVVTDGAGTIVHASINEKGTAVGGASGDQTGKEICTRSYYNYPWGCVLRYDQGGSISGSSGSTSGGQTYTVRSGDTLSNIAAKYGTTYQALASYNGIADPNRINVGQVIRIPGSTSGSSSASGSRTYTVRQGDSLWAIAASQLGNGSRYKEIKTLNGLTSDTIHAGQTLKLPN